MSLARPARRKSVCLTPSGIVVRIGLGFAGVLAVLFAMGSKPVNGQPREARTGQEKANKGQAKGGGSELIVWVVDGDRDGIAIALNDLRWMSPNWTILMQRCDKNEPTDLHAIVRDLINDKYVETMYPFSLTIKETRSDPSSHAKSYTVRFKFAKCEPPTHRSVLKGSFPPSHHPQEGLPEPPLSTPVGGGSRSPCPSGAWLASDDRGRPSACVTHLFPAIGEVSRSATGTDSRMQPPEETGPTTTSASQAVVTSATKQSDALAVRDDEN